MSPKRRKRSSSQFLRENEWANLARTEKLTDPETGETLEDEEIIEDTPLLINLKVSDIQSSIIIMVWEENSRPFNLTINFLRDVDIPLLLTVMFLQKHTIIYQM